MTATGIGLVMLWGESSCLGSRVKSNRYCHYEITPDVHYLYRIFFNIAQFRSIFNNQSTCAFLKRKSTYYVKVKAFEHQISTYLIFLNHVTNYYQIIGTWLSQTNVLIPYVDFKYIPIIHFLQQNSIVDMHNKTIIYNILQTKKKLVYTKPFLPCRVLLCKAARYKKWVEV